MNKLTDRSLLFSKAQRLLTAKDFEQVFASSSYRASHRFILVLAKPAEQNDKPGRLGLVIAKKHIRLAVDRNRVKRLIRESFRQHQHQLQGIDAIVLARKGLDELDNQAINSLVSKQWQKIVKKHAS